LLCGADATREGLAAEEIVDLRARSGDNVYRPFRKHATKRSRRMETVTPKEFASEVAALAVASAPSGMRPARERVSLQTTSSSFRSRFS
jgi:hypothetical protein